MPETKQLRLTAREVRKGDVISGKPVMAVQSKDKYTYITLEGDTSPIRWAHDILRIVERQVPTAEEKRWDKRQWIASDARKAMNGVQREVEEAIESFGKAGTYSMDSQWSYVQKYLDSVALQTVWAQVKRQYLGMAREVHGPEFGDDAHEGDDDDELLVQAVAATAERFAQRMIENDFAPTASNDVGRTLRSTMADVVSKWLRSFQVLQAQAYVKEYVKQ